MGRSAVIVQGPPLLWRNAHFTLGCLWFHVRMAYPIDNPENGTAALDTLSDTKLERKLTRVLTTHLIRCRLLLGRDILCRSLCLIIHVSSSSKFPCPNLVSGSYNGPL
ncbi:hypothetical protein BJ165DRAFT_74578 [Panaeolus papilionaceus]|nr:hypothetical protein BJ165DRAFT_74578 [Panaeolus papilionaceus]